MFKNETLWRKQKRKIFHEKHNYFGPKFSDIFIKNELIKSKISFIKPKNLSKYVAQKISDGKLIGWFQGSMELLRQSQRMFNPPTPRPAVRCQFNRIMNTMVCN